MAVVWRIRPCKVIRSRRAIRGKPQCTRALAWWTLSSLAGMGAALWSTRWQYFDHGALRVNRWTEAREKHVCNMTTKALEEVCGDTPLGHEVVNPGV